MHSSLAVNEIQGDKLAKVRPIISVCEESFARCLMPSQNLSVDEAMIRFDGRLGWKQYVPKKPVKWGLKLWLLCDASTLSTGYCVALSVYTGKDEHDEQLNLDLGYKVVMRLMRNNLLRYHHVYADNLFTSVHLAEDLLQADTHGKSFRRRLQRLLWTSDTDVMACKWRDKRDIHMLSTNDGGGDDVETWRNRQRVLLKTPTCVRKYNKFMGGVDRMDQLRSYYSGRRWWKYLFWGLLNIGTINAKILWALCNRPLPANQHTFSPRTFKMRLIHNLADDFIAARHQAPVLPVERLEADYTVSDDVVPNHPHRQKACVSCLLTRTQENDVGTAGGDAIQLPGVQCPPVQDRPMLWAISCLNVWIFTVC